MPVNNGVITGDGVNGLAVATVAKVIGSSQNSVANLIVQALIGGTVVWNGNPFKTAFKVVETHGEGASGEVIEGAKPYFSPFASKAPAVWMLEGATSDRRINYRIKNYYPINTELPYWDDLGHFDGYDNKANTGPSITGSVEYNNKTRTLSIAIDKVFGGSFDWNELKYTSGHQSTLLPIYLGVRLTIPLTTGERVETHFCTTAYDKTNNPNYQPDVITINNVAKPGRPVIAEFILGEGSTPCRVSSNAIHLADFIKNIAITESASLRIIFGINAARNQVEVHANRVGGTTTQAITLGGNFIGKVNGVSDARVSIRNPNFTLTIPAGSRTSNKAYAPVTIMWMNIGAKDEIEITGAITSNPSGLPYVLDSLIFTK